MMKRILMLLTAMLLILSLYACGKKPAPEPSPSPSAANRGEIVTTATPAPDPTPRPTPEPVGTPDPAEHTPTPLPEDTPAPSETPAETPEPVIVNPSVLASGSFRGDTGTALNLIADWRAVSLGDNEARITITLSLESYSLDIGERRGNILTFNGEDYYFMTDAIEISGGDFAKTQIYVWSKDIPLSELSFTLAARWNLLGSYSRQEMEAIELSGSYEYRP